MRNLAAVWCIAVVVFAGTARGQSADEAEANKRAGGEVGGIAALERRVANLEKENKALSEKIAARERQVQMDALVAQQWPSTRLCDAVIAGDVAAVKSLAKSSPDLLEVPGGLRRETPLVAAVRTGNKETVAILLDAGAKVDNTADGFTPLVTAVGLQYRQIAQLLLERKANVNATGSNGTTALHIAAQKGDKEMMDLLLSKNADVNALDSTGRPPLFPAIQSRKKELVEILIAHGAKLDLKDKTGYIATRLACPWRPDDSTDILNLLLAKGAPTDITVWICTGNLEKVKQTIQDDPKTVTTRGPNDWTPLHVAADCHQTEIMRILMDNGADIEATDRDNYTPLWLAVGHSGEGQENAVKLLLDRGAKIDGIDKSGQPLILLADGRPAALKLLVDKGADINAQDRDGNTLAHWAVMRGDAKALEYVLSFKPDLTKKNKKGQTARDLAQRRNDLAELFGG